MDELLKLIDNFLFHCRYEKNLSPHSLKAYKIDLEQFRCFLFRTLSVITIKEINKSLIRDYLKELFINGKPKTIKRKIATLKCFMNYLEYEEVIDINPFYRLRLNIKEGKQLPRTIELKRIKKIFIHLYGKKNKLKQTDKNYKTLLRDIAVLELLFATGMRVSELSYLATKNINLIKGIVLIKGKGSRERIIPIADNRILDAQNFYYEVYQNNIEKGKYFFINRLNNRLSEQSIRLMIRKYIKELNIPQNITPHMFRHSLATLLLENGVDIRYIQNILGHSSIITTQIYAQVNEAPKRKILRAKHPRVKFSI